MATVIELTPELCESVTQQKGVVLLYFRAEWCGACKTMARIMDQVIEETPAELVIAKCDIETCIECATSYEVTSIPRMVIFKDGVEQKRINGAVGKAALLEDLLPLLNK
ncbi:MAG: thioredoxin family protein [Lentisphaeria bacterium]|nr:thioredoxin family protein [Lentisphaeria bacterium]